MIRILPFCLSLLLLSACASGASVNTELTTNSPYGLVVLGVKANPNDVWGSDINFALYDPASQKLITADKHGQTTFTAGRVRTDDEYYVLKFNPGTYILSSTEYLDNRPQGTPALLLQKNDTIMITVQPGKAIYVGDFTLSHGRVGHADRNFDAARQKLAKYRDVRGELADIIPERVSWTND